MSIIGKYLIVIGIVLIIAGLLLYFIGDKFSWFGNLPGDIKVEKENFKFYFPITSMILISIVLSFLMYLLRKFF
ncbi:MAG: DUF2905 domain-containing protein [Bacteroidales bacterium]|jgi:magnesium-transporting ATPase (P-type)|nr:DUF2905 domain-containing protein [Bacteroidales bacterium]HOL97454.1 DUF2905 domain-containing protein [Bacteroidales bacterium]HOM36026.1 DUF2905 domain-containing protein [Bacteroidales bacterium]HPD23336.1 DUF2905 domain-containing protein [Bacteroidales bacterium]HRS99728.1 DUF2905 domain-containing protein [Bacteroidales bacterium]